VYGHIIEHIRKAFHNKILTNQILGGDECGWLTLAEINDVLDALERNERK
jgi:hypothetical protein